MKTIGNTTKVLLGVAIQHCRVYALVNLSIYDIVPMIANIIEVQTKRKKYRLSREPGLKIYGFDKTRKAFVSVKVTLQSRIFTSLRNPSHESIHNPAQEAPYGSRRTANG